MWRTLVLSRKGVCMCVRALLEFFEHCALFLLGPGYKLLLLEHPATDQAKTTV